jgi:O-antigen/teichoic acid export membrane protein
MGNTQEVGFYGAATALSSLTLLLSPLIGWVLTPMLARAAARSREELFEQTRRSLELVMTVAIPVSMMINLGAEFWIHVVFGQAFMPAAIALRIQATMFVLTYVSIIYWTVVVMLERTWALTLVLFAGLVVNVGLNLAMIRPAMSYIGLGGGGAGAAMAMLATEIVVVTLMMGLVGRSAFDRRNVSTIAKSLLAFGVVILLDRALQRIGPFRLVADAVVYLAIVIATGALRVRETLGVVRQAVAERKQRRKGDQ